MSIANVIEVISEGDSVDEAIENAVEDAGKTVSNIKSVYVESIQAVVDDGEIETFRVNAKVTFIVKS